MTLICGTVGTWYGHMGKDTGYGGISLGVTLFRVAYAIYHSCYTNTYIA